MDRQNLDSLSGDCKTQDGQEWSKNQSEGDRIRHTSMTDEPFCFSVVQKIPRKSEALRKDVSSTRKLQVQERSTDQLYPSNSWTGRRKTGFARRKSSPQKPM